MEKFFELLTSECQQKQEILIKREKFKELDLKYRKQLTNYLLKKLIHHGPTYVDFTEFLENVSESLEEITPWLDKLGLYNTRIMGTEIRVDLEWNTELRWLHIHPVIKTDRKRNEIMTVIEKFGEKHISKDEIYIDVPISQFSLDYEVVHEYLSFFQKCEILPDQYKLRIYL